jgi:histidinol phosphatase-like PHP family hydrolase
MGEREMTDRMVAAIEHPHVDAIGHPTGARSRPASPTPSTSSA